MGEIMEIIIGILACIIMGLFTYIGVHIQEERRQGNHIPLLWEKGGFFKRTKRKIFDKSDLKYRDGDNT